MTKNLEREKMYNFFLELWDEQEDVEGNCYCFETGKKMPRSVFRHLSTCYHHILPKKKYENYKYLKKNIKIILPDIHTQVEGNIEKTPRIEKYTKKLLSLHKKGEL